MELLPKESGIPPKLRLSKMIKFSQTRSEQTGFSLIELLVATMVVGLTLTAIVTTLTYSIKVNDQANYRDIAIQKAQEGVDFFKRERVILGWNNFYNLLNSSYCLDEIPDPSTSSSDHAFSGLASSCTDFDIPITGAAVEFKRTVSIDKSGGDEVDITVTVSWPLDDSNASEVEVSQLFKEW